MKYKKVISFIASAIALAFLADTAQASTRYYGSYLCGYSGFECVKVKRGDTWEKLFPNERNREIVMRLNRTNMPVKYRSWIVVPTNLRSISHMELSPFPLEHNTNGKKLVIVNLTKQAFGAYDQNGKLVRWGPVSGGKGYCPDVGRACNTATGTFKIYRKQGESCVSSKFPIETNGGAPMPYCMHFSGGFALHGSTLPGYNASHGCVRLFFEDAKWMNHEFTDIGTPVIVTR
ncbi:MAG: endopeptidase IV [Gammaproteobacteria bacterium RIFCSPLOWO2_02_FULL_42_14]|nr:MAG: endopeptidase IV [Gammaproteobacteria bacterium RIFCSPHIGHO2_02_FULL_42_43]OGT51578.1 MAG: endopeptidase IV [Gammaproteobacteria bacterium RIFCSPHIGHO2_12_FULL_41_25]OGT62277.1 MAG: endopeptidase IV [Gammaproteobacteria bacterium RIFCSPLOWO2_02_FULL_42_14]OGT85951.1 MAG: endopeptidase IV [Gammaproteobacteria bacterium RIFCSPLOWO2_12_FULL_42_18]